MGGWGGGGAILAVSRQPSILALALELECPPPPPPCFGPLASGPQSNKQSIADVEWPPMSAPHATATQSADPGPFARAFASGNALLVFQLAEAWPLDTSPSSTAKGTLG
jgi:hypothetical protein